MDDTFRFKCWHCGKCCKNQQEVIFTARDLFRVARKKEISTHDCKPTLRAFYPLGCVLLNSEMGDSLSEDLEPRVKYVLNDCRCGSAKRVNTVRDWLARFGIPEQDSFFLEWNGLLLSVSKAAYSLQESEKREELNALRDKALFISI